MKTRNRIVGLVVLCLLIAGCAGVPGENSRGGTTGSETVMRVESVESVDFGIVSAESSEESFADGRIDWDANRDWPVYHGEVPGVPLDVFTEVVEVSLKDVVTAFDAAEAELLFHVFLVPMSTNLSGRHGGNYLQGDALSQWEAWMESIGVPATFYQQRETLRGESYAIYHFNLSYRDMYELYRQGLEEKYWMYFGACTRCEEYSSMTNIAAPEIPAAEGSWFSDVPPKHPHVSREPS